MKKFFTRMGHSALHVADLKRSLDFYQNQLGLEVEWDGDKDWANLRLQNDDLSLVLKDGAKHPPHLGFRVATREDLKAAYSELKNKGVVVEDIQGHRDGTMSFYFYDPDGNTLEALWDARAR